MNPRLHQLLGIVAAACLAQSVAGCGKSRDQAAAEAVSAESSITERNGAAEVTWNVTPDGQLSAKVRDKDGMPITSGVSGSVTVKPAGGGAPVTVPLVQSGGVLTAQLPKLDADLTDVGYELDVGGQKAQGSLQLPRGGTKELVDSAQEAAAAKQIPPGTKGPNGGVVQVVGDDIVEVVADKDSGAVRMYMLSDDLKVVPVGKRKGKLALSGASTDMIDLTADPSGMYLVGKAGVKVQPAKVTIVVVDGDEVDVALCNYVPGGVIIVGPAAVLLPVFIVTGWVVVVPGPVIVQPGVIVKKGKGKGKFKVKVW